MLCSAVIMINSLKMPCSPEALPGHLIMISVPRICNYNLNLNIEII